MSAHINANVLKRFIVKTIGADKLARDEARKFDIDDKKFEKANTIDENNYLELDEIIENDDLYEQFATLYVEELEKNNDIDKEKEKEEALKVKDKNGAGV